MKKRIAYCLIFFLLITGVLGTSVICFGEEHETESGALSDKIASEDEKAPSQEVGEAGMIAVYGDDVKDGTYDITVDSSSSMFNIVEAELTVKDGSMYAVMTMGGTGYLKLFMGTAEEAVEADESQYIPYEEKKDGSHTFKVPVEALNKVVDCASFSKKKEKWYDRELVFRADSLPTGAVLTDLDAGKLDYKDGEYTIEVEMTGGTGRASITSPAMLYIEDGEATARIEWSSPNYDYMIVQDRKYFPLAGEETSVVEIHVYVFDSPVTVIGDTTAMSKPYEIEYTLTFDSDTIKKAGGISAAVITIAAAAAVVILIIAVFAVRKNKNHEKKKQ